MRQKYLTMKNKRNDNIKKWRKKLHRKQKVSDVCQNEFNTDDDDGIVSDKK